MLKFSTLFTCNLLFFLSSHSNAQEHSIAREWNDELLFAISEDFARPTVHARNLFHVSAAMYDSWAAYTPSAETWLLGKTHGTFNSTYEGVPNPDNILFAQNEAISHAVYRMILHRFQTSPGLGQVLPRINDLMSENGFDINNTSTDYFNDGPAALGNYIAAQYIAFGLQDGSNEGGNYANLYYVPANPPVAPENPGNPNMLDPNRWQQISLTVSIDQSGNPVASTPSFLGPEWGNVYPFSLDDSVLTVAQRDGHNYNLYHDPGMPVLLDTNDAAGLESAYKWNFLLVSIWQSHHRIDDNVSWDISPRSQGNIQSYPTTQEGLEEFYDLYGGGDTGEGYDVNPVTGMPYEPQIVKRGDYSRVLAEYWADGPNSVTPPGHWFDILHYAMDHPLFERKWMGEGEILSDLEYDVKAFFALGGAMHDVAISAWGIKGYYDYPRPVSAIRFMGDHGQCSNPALDNFDPAGLPIIPGHVEVVEAGDPLAGDDNEHIGKMKLYTWKGPDYIGNPNTDMAGVGWILAEEWWPYQRPTFVTPPFAGYVSGHSTFSRSAAELMTLMTGSAYFPGGMSNFVAGQNEFLVFEQGPSEEIILQWATYRDASDQCSLSRIWGGIHPPIDDIPGRFMGMKIGPNAFHKANSIVSAVKPIVLEVASSEQIYNTSNIGSEISVSITFDREMNTAISPQIDFPEGDPTIEAIALQNAEWIDNDTYVLTYILEDVEYESDNTIIRIQGASDMNGLDQSVHVDVTPFLIDTKKPVILEVVPDFSIVNDFQTAGGLLLIDFTFSESCDIALIPEISLNHADDLSASFSFSTENSFWTSQTTYTAAFEMSDNNQEAFGIGISVDNIGDLAGNVLQPVIVENLITLDTKNPVTSAVSLSDNILGLNDLGSTALVVELTFEEPMNTDINPQLIFTGDDPLALSLVANTTNTIWLSSTNCQLAFDLQFANEELNTIQVSLANFKDLQGNISTTILDNLFVVDTKRPEVTEVNLSTEVISDLQVGSGGFEIFVAFAENMNTLQLPLVTVSNTDGTLTPQFSLSSWDDDFTFKAVFLVTDQNVEIDDLDVTVNFARDLAENEQLVHSVSPGLSIDTKNPELIAVTANVNDLTNSQAGSNGFFILSAYNEPMSLSSSVEVQFVPTEPAISILSANLDESTWISPFSYQNSFDVNAMAANVQGIGIVLSNAQDEMGNLMVPFSEEDFLSLVMESVGTRPGYNPFDMVFYPVPLIAGDRLNLRMGINAGNLTLRLFDLQGRAVYSEYFPVMNAGHYALDLPSLPSGLYLFEIRSMLGVHTAKITISY